MSKLPLDQLSPNARELLYAILEAFRRNVKPDWEPERFRAAALKLMEDGHGKIVDTGKGFQFEVTQKGVDELLTPEDLSQIDRTNH